MENLTKISDEITELERLILNKKEELKEFKQKTKKINLNELKILKKKETSFENYNVLNLDNLDNINLVFHNFDKEISNKKYEIEILKIELSSKKRYFRIELVELNNLKEISEYLKKISERGLPQ